VTITELRGAAGAGELGRGHSWDAAYAVAEPALAARSPNGSYDAVADQWDIEGRPSFSRPYDRMMIYEIREYTTVPGRMPALVKRFNEHTLGYFRKHGMEVVFLTLTELGSNSNNELVYVLRFDSYDDMVTKWAAMQADRGWQEARSASEVDGPIVATINRRVLSPAAFEAAR
jgi:hypothetical protein